jgi:hypothetical protein
VVAVDDNLVQLFVGPRRCALGAEVVQDEQWRLLDLVDVLERAIKLNPEYAAESPIPGRLRYLRPSGGPTYDTPNGRVLDDHGVDEAFATAPAPTTPPTGYEPDLYGDWDPADWTFVTEINPGFCDTTRFGMIPILVLDDDAEPSQWPSGSSGKMRVKGHLWIFIDEPNGPGFHHTGNDNIDEVTVHHLWFDEGVTCTDEAGTTIPFQPGSPKAWSLVSN